VHRQLRSWFPSSPNYGFRCNTLACSHNRPSCTCQWPFVQSLGPKSKSRPREWLSNKELSSKYPREKTCRQPIVKRSGPGNGGRQLQERVKTGPDGSETPLVWTIRCQPPYISERHRRRSLLNKFMDRGSASLTKTKVFGWVPALVDRGNQGLV
jgi:hypothetical protein